MYKRLKWAVLSVIWILMRLIMIPLDMFLAISCTIGILYHNAHVLYCNMLYKRFLALYGIISVEIGILEAGADEDDYIKQTGEYKERMLKVIKKGG